MRMLIVGLGWPPETFLRRLINGLMESGIDITVATAERPPREWTSRPQFHWLYAPSWSGTKAARSLRLLRVVAGRAHRIPRDVRRLTVPLRVNLDPTARLQGGYRLLPFAGKDWDVIYFPWNGTAATYLPLFDWGIPVILSCRGRQVNMLPHTRPELIAGLRATFERAAAVHCVSQDILDESVAFGLDPAKARVIRPAVDPGFFFPKTSSKRSGFRVVTTGSMIWRKGYEYALLAVRRLLEREMPASLDIIGDGPERQRIQYTIRDLDLGGAVRLHGRLTPEHVRDRLQESDAFLLASHSEGISNAVLEAMACGIPAVTTDCGGMREAVTDGVEGFVVPVRDASAMADALEQLARDDARRQEMGRAARRRIVSEFSLDDQARQFASLIDLATSPA